MNWCEPFQQWSEKKAFLIPWNANFSHLIAQLPFSLLYSIVFCIYMYQCVNDNRFRYFIINTKDSGARFNYVLVNNSHSLLFFRNGHIQVKNKYQVMFGWFLFGSKSNIIQLAWVHVNLCLKLQLLHMHTHPHPHPLIQTLTKHFVLPRIEFYIRTSIRFIALMVVVTIWSQCTAQSTTTATNPPIEWVHFK